MPDAPEPGLSARLRDGTREAHRAAERGAFVRAFLGARRPDRAGPTGPTIDRDLYRAYLIALHAVYTALEAGLERHREHPVVGPLALPYLYRAPALAADLQTLSTLEQAETHPRERTREHTSEQTPYPPANAQGASPVPAALALAAHLHELADRDPALLVAHAYTRYLGDLSGGQILRGAAARILGVPDDGPGLRFYDFPQIPDLNACKADLRARLDALPLAPAGVTALVAEARDAFAYNAAVFADLLPA
jgi:heme oxygenase